MSTPRNTTCRHGVMTGPDLDGEECVDCATTDLECLDRSDGECKGPVEYRTPLSATGRSFPRCDHHWDKRLDVQDGINRRYPTHAPSDFDPSYAGESWDEEY